MPLIVTPRQLTLRSELYYQLNQLLSAGIGLPSALASIAKNAPSRALRDSVQIILGHVRDGYTFGDAMVKAKGALPQFDVALLQAGEQSGRLDQCCKLLANNYREQAALQSSVISGLLYPAFVFHFAVLLLPISLLTKLVLEADWLPFVLDKAMVFGPVYGIIFAILYASQGQRGEYWRGVIERIAGMIPLVGSARRDLAMARMTAALEALISAGVDIITAWEMAATASGSVAIKKEVMSWRPALENEGLTPSEMVAESSVFPDVFQSLYHSAEISGSLDTTLRRSHTYFQEESTRKMKIIADWMPRLVYFIMAGRIAYQIVNAFKEYTNTVGRMLE